MLPFTRIAATAGLTLAVGLAMGCVSSKPADDLPPDEQFGHRYEESPDARLTLSLTPPDTAQSYFYYPAVFDTVHVRPAPFAATPGAARQVPVEVLVKGALPDACTELHDVAQERLGHILHVTLRMRRPQGAVCASVVRPYRFYVMLEGRYEPGSYTLKLNEQAHPFEVRLPDELSQE